MVKTNEKKKCETRKVVRKECSICFEKIKKKHKTNLYQDEKECCKHTFCLSCIKKWAKKNNTCPLCRKEFNVLKTKRVRLKITPPRKLPWELPLIEMLVLTDRYRPLFERRLNLGRRIERHLYQMMCIMITRPTCPFDEATINWITNLEGSANNPIVVI